MPPKVQKQQDKPQLGAMPFAWEATSPRGEIMVHLLPRDGAVPFCRRRQGARGKQLVQVVAKGDTLEQLLGVTQLSSLCPDCVRVSGYEVPRQEQTDR